jgi:hypothetical protein
MTMAITSLMLPDGPTDYYDQGFRNVLEDHFPLLRASNETEVHTVEPDRAYRFEFDLFGLFNSYSIPAHLHWPIMRMNKMSNPNEVTRDFSSFLLPNATKLEQIRQAYTSSRRITS